MAAALTAWALAALLLPLLLFLWLRGAAARARVARCGALIPGPPPLPIIGNILDVGISPKKLCYTATKLYGQYGNLFRIWLGPTHLFVILADPRDIEALLSKSKNLKKSFTYTFLHPWLGSGLLTSSGERWKSHRKIITPTFHFTILEQFVDVFNKQGKVLLSILKKKEGAKPFDICPLIDLYTHDVICETAMGVKLHSQTEGYTSSYLRSVKNMCELVMKRSSKPWLHPNFIYRLSSQSRQETRNLEILHGMTNEVIRRKRKQLEGNPAIFQDTPDETGRKRKLAFLDLLLNSSRDGNSLSDEDIREEVDTFMFEGHDTTASAICFALMELSRRCDIQERIFDELKEVAPSTINSSEEFSLNLEHLNRLKYLEQVIKETLRLHPTVPIIGRETTEDLELSSRAVTIPPGVTVAVVPFLAHRNPEQYPDPEVFNPDNFLPEAVSKRDPFAFVPFSAGPRNCIGQKFAMLEIKSVLAKIIWNYSLQMDPNFELELIPEITLKSLHGTRLSVAPRVKS